MFTPSAGALPVVRHRELRLSEDVHGRGPQLHRERLFAASRIVLGAAGVAEPLDDLSGLPLVVRVLHDAAAYLGILGVGWGDRRVGDLGLPRHQRVDDLLAVDGVEGGAAKARVAHDRRVGVEQLRP